MTDVSSIIISHGEKSDLNEARDDVVLGMQWHQLDHMQTICTSHTHTPTHLTALFPGLPG